MIKKKTAPLFTKVKAENVDTTAGIIRGVVILEEGADKVGDHFDAVALKQLTELGNIQGAGVKARFGHPNACNDALGTYIGRYKNFNVEYIESINKHAVTADLHLDETAKALPKLGDAHSYILKMAGANNDMFGNSIVYRAGEPEVKTVKDTNGQDKEMVFERFDSFIASDLVDSPAATTSLFKNTDSLAEIATEFLEDNPQLFEAVAKDESILTNFLTKFKQYKDQQIKMKKEKSFVEKVKALFDEAINGTKKDISATTTDGADINISDTDGDGVAMVGDTVTDSGGSPMASATITTTDGLVIVTDEAGVITSVTAAMSEPAATPAETAAEKSLKLEIEKLKADHAKEQEEVIKQFEELKNKFKEIKSTYTPPVKETQFSPKDNKTALTREERKAEILKRLPDYKEEVTK